MYPVTEQFKTKIKETTRTFKLSLQIQHSAGTLTLTDEDIISNTLQMIESSQSTDNFSIGGVVASSLEFSIINKTDSIHGFFLVDTILTMVNDLLKPVDYYEEYSGINFEGATIIPQVALLVSENPHVWEYVPLGRFNVDEVNKTRNAIQLKAIDNMIELDKPYSLSKLGYPATLYQIYTNICTVADVQPATTSFINQDYLVTNRPDGDYTLRDVLAFVAQLSGCFARFNRNGALELAWYTDSGLTLTPGNRFKFVAREDLVQIKGISYMLDDVIYLAGTDEYVVDLTDNPLLQDNFQAVISNMYNKVKDTIFTPYESRWQGDPAIQTGDKITQIDRDGKSYSTIVTHSTYKYRGASTLAARGMPIKAKRYTGSANKKIAEIKRKIEKDMGDKLTSLEQAQLNVTELIANMLGGYVVRTDDALYIADNPDINEAQKVWKWGIGGFGYSSAGVAGPYTAGISADGTIVAMLVAANIVTANMVKTGILTSNAGNMVVDLDNNVMRVADSLGHNRVLLGEYDTGKFGIQIKDSVNNRTLLDDKGLLNSWQGNMTENFDSNHSAKLKFYLPNNIGEIIDLRLSFSLQKFRNYVDMIGLSSVQTVGTGPEFIFPVNTSSDGAHTHSVSYNQYTGYSVSSHSGHSHSIDLEHSHQVDLSHDHRLRHSIYEEGTSQSVGIKIDDVDVTKALGGVWNGEVEISDLNIKSYITTKGWHTIEFFMPPKPEGNPIIGRVVANIFGMVFMYAPN